MGNARTPRGPGGNMMDGLPVGYATMQRRLEVPAGLRKLAGGKLAQPPVGHAELISAPDGAGESALCLRRI
jgi:hypothetical protein